VPLDKRRILLISNRMKHAHFVPAVMATLFALLPVAQADSDSDTRTALRVFTEKMGQGRFDRLDEIYGPGFVAHSATSDYSLEEDNESGKAWRAAFPDLQVSVLRTVANGDLVAVHWKGIGTNTVAGAGLPGKGKKASVEGMTFFRFKDGRIVEEWSLIDMATLMKQLS
jgi:steroid delta-isomerase-like uncharacterized protein